MIGSSYSEIKSIYLTAEQSYNKSLEKTNKKGQMSS